MMMMVAKVERVVYKMKINVSMNLLVVLTVVLAVLKVTSVIAISWFWVFFPILLPILAFLTVCFLWIAIMGIVAFVFFVLTILERR